MPDLPDVYTVRRGLEGFILGQDILRVKVLTKKSLIGKFVPGKVVKLRRFGKALIIDLDNNKSLMIHLRMTGQLIYDPAREPSTGNVNNGNADADADASDVGDANTGDADVSDTDSDADILSIKKRIETRFAAGHPSENFVAELPNKQTRVILEFTYGTLFFNDQRTAEELVKNLRKHPKSAIKAVILDQSVVAGLGNIYADEALWCARIHPERRAGTLEMTEVGDLLSAMREVMEKLIEAGGSTMRNYVKADGTRGDYLDLFAKVYGRDGQPCARCGSIIKKTKVGRRGTRYCPKCQQETSG